MGINDNKTTTFDRIDTLGDLNDVTSEVGYVVRKCALDEMLRHLGCEADELRKIEVITNSHDGKEGGFDEVRFHIGDSDRRYKLYIDVEHRYPDFDHLVDEPQERWQVLIYDDKDSESRNFTYYEESTNDGSRADMAREHVDKIAEFLGMGAPLSSYQEAIDQWENVSQTLSEADTSESSKARDMADRIVELLEDNPELQQAFEKGEADVHGETIEATKIIGEYAGDFHRKASKAHGNSKLSSFEDDARQFIRDLDKLDIGEIDWDARTDKEVRKARKAERRARETIMKLQRQINRTSETIDEIDQCEPSEEGCGEAWQYRLMLEGLADDLEDLYSEV